jgi:sterol desaturase/sphingolipid hydroxylase (fatty acid hydroxylase superfamily)
MEKLGFIAFLIPLLFIMVAVEWILAHRQGKDYYNLSDVVVNLCCGLLERLFDFFWIIISFFVFTFVHDHFALFSIPNTALTFVLLVFCADLAGYWFHRLSHEINFMWAAHIVHHQSEELNLTTVFRVSAFAVIFRTPFWSIVPLIGFDPAAVTVAITIIGFYQMLVHTRLVKNWGVLEKFLVTPSNHRVHHAYNDAYLDTNYGGIFIIWDRIFGTYQPEQEPVKFGITSGFRSTDPFKAHLFYWKYLFRLAARARKWQEKIRVFFAHPRWLPEGLQYEAPEYEVDEEGQRVKFKPVLPLPIGIYVLVNSVTTAFLFVYMISFRESLAPFQIGLITGVILLSILTHGRVLEQKRGYIPLEFFRHLALLAVLPVVAQGFPYLPALGVVVLAIWFALVLRRIRTLSAEVTGAPRRER